MSNVHHFWFGKPPAIPAQEYNDLYEYTVTLIKEPERGRMPVVFTCVMVVMLFKNPVKTTVRLVVFNHFLGKVCSRAARVESYHDKLPYLLFLAYQRTNICEENASQQQGNVIADAVTVTHKIIKEDDFAINV